MLPPEEGERPERRVEFLAMGPMHGAFAEDLVSRASRRIAAPCRLRRLPSFPIPMLETRGQADADRLLASLEAQAPDNGSLLVGLTNVDLANPIFTFFFGRARLGGSAAVVSVSRLSPAFYGLPDDPVLTAQRAVLEILHELGHCAGLPHCEDRRCLMRVVHTVDDLDARGSAFCPACVERLPLDLR